jgi:hypothetical protein
MTTIKNCYFSFFAHTSHFYRKKCAWLARSPTRRGNSIMMLFVFFLALLLSKFFTNNLAILLKKWIILRKQFFV